MSAKNDLEVPREKVSYDIFPQDIVLNIIRWKKNKWK